MFFPFFLFLISLAIEASNDFSSKLLLGFLPPFSLLFLRNFFSVVILFFFMKIKEIDFVLLGQIFLTFLVLWIGKLLILASVLGLMTVSFGRLLFFFIFLVIFFFYFCRNSVVVWRSLFTFAAFSLTTYQMQNFSMYEIASTYFSIPIFSSILSFFVFREKFKKFYLFEIGILSYLVFKNSSVGIFFAVVGCLCFSVCEILIKLSKRKILDEIFYLSLALILYFGIFVDRSQIFPQISLCFSSVSSLFYLGLVVLGGIFLQILLPLMFRKISFIKLMSFRFVSLLFGNILDGQIWSFTNLVVFAFILIDYLKLKRSR